MSEADRKFEPVDDPVEALSLLREAAKGVASTIVWTRDQLRVISTHCSHVSEADQVLQLATPKDLDPRDFIEDLHRQGSAGCLFSISVAKANLFFESEFLGTDSAGLRFRLPAKIFKIQRRSDMRIPVPDGYVIRFEFEDPVFPDQKHSKKVIDLSAGGVSILVEERELPHFTIGFEFPEVRFQVGQRKIQCPAEVRHTSKMPPGSRLKGGKVGFQFKGLKAEDRNHIAAYVDEQARKYFSTLMKKG